MRPVLFLRVPQEMLTALDDERPRYPRLGGNGAPRAGPLVLGRAVRRKLNASASSSRTTTFRCGTINLRLKKRRGPALACQSAAFQRQRMGNGRDGL